MKSFDENKIDDFLLGRMVETELQEFKNKLSMDKEFANQVNQRKEAIRYIDVLGDMAMKDRVKRLHKKAVNNLPPEKVFRITPLLKYAAVIALLIVAGYWLLQSPVSSSDIFQQNYQAYELNFGERGNSTEDITIAAGQFYSDGNYRKAIDLFEDIPPESISAKVILAKGISYLETGQLTKAVNSFQQLIDNKDPIYEEHAQWYLAMTYFKQEKEKEAITLVEQIANKSGSFNYQKAKEILDLY